MSNYASITPIYCQWDRGSHQLVSEQSDPALESSKEGSSGHGESGGTTTARGRASTVEDRILSIEDTMRALSGTVFNISNQFDKIEGRFDGIEVRVDNFERMLEELARSRHDHEFSNPKLHQTPSLHSPIAVQNSLLHQTPSLHSPIAVQNSFPHIHMSTSPVNANMNHPWRGSPPVMHQALSDPEQTPEESIRFLRAIAQKYKGDSKSPEEQLQILAAVAQKYRVPKESSSFDYPPTAVHMKEVDARPIRAMKFYDSPVVGIAVQSKVISDLPKLVGNLKSLAKSNPSGGVDTVKHEVGNQSSDIDAAVQKVVSHDVASSELSLSDLLSLQEVNMSVGSLALFAGGMVHKSDSLVVYTIEEFGGPNIAVVGELREKIPAISAVQIFFYIYKLANSSFSINDNSSQSFIFSDSSSQASVMIWDPGKVQASSSGRPLSKSVIEINSEAEALVRARQDMREAMGKLGLSFLKLGNFEIKEAIYDSQRTRAADFKRLATDVDRASRSYRELNAQSVKHLDILHQYLGMMLDVHSAFSNRPSTLLTVQTLISDLSSLHTRDEGLEAASSKMEVEKDSMFFQFLHSSKELAKETANFTFQVFIMNHNGQMVPKFSFQAKVWDSGI